MFAQGKPETYYAYYIRKLRFRQILVSLQNSEGLNIARHFINKFSGVMQLHFNIFISYYIKVIIVTALAGGKSVSYIIRVFTIEDFFFDVMLLEVADKSAVLFEIDLFDSKKSPDGIKNSII